MKIYICGPMEGKSYRNRFAIAQIELEQAGHVVINPTKLAGPHMTLAQYREATRDFLDACDAMLVLDGWQNIAGCNAEMARAIENKMIITFEGGKGCQNPSRPEPEISRKKPEKKFMKGIKGVSSVRKGITSRRR
ncbi:MAG: DUF4406 domain-containing protein [Lachnospiraceae bacterium]|nr:DUF4406 domain-containing protein [Lachnospiraceae bacterium]